MSRASLQAMIEEFHTAVKGCRSHSEIRAVSLQYGIHSKDGGLYPSRAHQSKEMSCSA